MSPKVLHKINLASGTSDSYIPSGRGASLITLFAGTMVIRVINATLNTVILGADYLQIENSAVRGGLFSLLHVNDAGDVNFNKSVYIVLNEMESIQFMLSNVSQGNYTVLAFCLKQNGRFELGQVPPATIASAIVSGQG